MELEQIVCRINVLSETSCEGQIELGGLLINAKSKVKHGTWKKWLDENTDFSQSKANKLMKVYEFVNSLKSSTCTNLEVRKLFALTSLKEEIDVEIFMENYDLENMSVREIEKEVKLYNKQLKQDIAEDKKAQKKMVEVKSTEEEIPTYTKIHTEIKVDNVSYYPLDEVCGVMNKTLNNFLDKYSNLVISIKGNDCVKVDDFVKILADSKENNVNEDDVKVKIAVHDCEESIVGYGASYLVRLKDDKWKSSLIQINSYSDVVLHEGVYYYSQRTITKRIEEELTKLDALDKNTFDYVFNFIASHLETIEEQMYKAKQYSDASEKASSDAWNRALNSQSNTLDKNEYRKLAKVCHPDAGGSEELMNIISKLYNKAA